MKKLNITVMISGSGTNLQAVIDKIHKDEGVNGQISLVISNNEGAYGLTRAKNSNIDTLVINKGQYTCHQDYEEALVNTLDRAGTDLIVLAGYLAVVPERVIEIYQNRIINIHPSLIPSFCGKGFYGNRVHEGALAKGVKVSGATVHFVNNIMDDGPIIMQRCVDVDFNDSAQDLQEKVLKVEHEILPLAIKLFIEDKIRVVGNRVQVL